MYRVHVIILYDQLTQLQNYKLLNGSNVHVAKQVIKISLSLIILIPVVKKKAS